MQMNKDGISSNLEVSLFSKKWEENYEGWCEYTVESLENELD